jgi:hypothetical protein
METSRVLLSTDLLLEDERQAGLDVVPWHTELRPMSGRVASVLRNKAIDLIDVAIGLNNHARAALVATHEGLDTLLQATMDLAESVVRELAFQRVAPLNPLGRGEVLSPPEDPTRLALRFSKFAIEDSAVRTIAGIDHLLNAYLRFAWEANAARVDELKACGFKPGELEPESWASYDGVKKGLDQSRRRSLALLPSFELTAPTERVVAAPAVHDTRAYRNEVVHRARPQYRELPPYGRSTLWAQDGFSITLRDQEHDPPDPGDTPTMTERREMVGGAITEGLAFAEALWDFVLRWLPTVGIFVRHDRERDETEVTTEILPGTRAPRYPRAQRDPGPFLQG